MYARDVTLVSPIALALFGGRLKIFDRHCVVAVEGGCFPSFHVLSLLIHPEFLRFFLSSFYIFFVFLLLPVFSVSLLVFCFVLSSFLFLYVLLLFIHLFLQHLLTIILTIISPSNLNPLRMDCVQSNIRSFETSCFSTSVCRASIRREGRWVT